MMNFKLSYDANMVVLTIVPQKANLIKRIIGSSLKEDLDHVHDKLAEAIAELRYLADTKEEQLAITADKIIMSAHLAASLSKESAEQFDLPPFVNDLAVKFDVENIVGDPNFKLIYEWQRYGKRELPHRSGAILETDRGIRRIPVWLLEAIEIADNHSAGQGLAADWEALGRFRRKLEPGAGEPDNNRDGRIAMTDFLSGIKVQLVDRFSISPTGEDDFKIIPFDGEHIKELLDENGKITEDLSEIDGINLKRFQRMIKERGSLTAYRVQPGHFVVVEQSAKPALDVMARMQKAPSSERREFIQNPGLKIREAVIEKLRHEGKFDGLSAEAEEELIENSSDYLFVETKEYSERVIGIAEYRKPDIGGFETSNTTWFPEDFSRHLKEKLDTRSIAEVEEVKQQVQAAIEQGQKQTKLEDLVIPAKPLVAEALDSYIEERLAKADHIARSDEVEEKRGPWILDTKVNFDDLEWLVKLMPRKTDLPNDIPSAITTPLKDHQRQSLQWQIDAWRAGLPGVLNADEQGLGKTLQTISFLAWLKQVTAKEETEHRGPILIVAPTSLLNNWEEEVSRHMDRSRLGTLFRVYGSSINFFKTIGVKGKDTDSGEEKLNFGDVLQANQEGRAHRYWFLTTYTTLDNYQFSFARIPFSAIVFDEIQRLKNPTTRAFKAASSMQADFRIGLTGTPIENSTDDLWSIMDQLSPGTLNTLKEFRQRYKDADEAHMAELHARIFKPRNTIPPLALRRIKDQVAKDLPAKTRRLHPKLMPDIQAEAYKEARLKLLTSKRGAQLKVLHHIRTVSVHPDIELSCDDRHFIDASARLKATMEILQKIKAHKERALVFIESIKMQYRFIELVRSQFGLAHVDLINGRTPLEQRQKIVNHFQRHLTHDEGFDVLVLGPKAAGMGLTLTAATHVIHLSRWWNPAVEEQCNDRVHRIGQQKPVEVHIPMAIHAGFQENSFDCNLHSLMMRKRHLANATLWPMGDNQNDVAILQQNMAAEQHDRTDDPIKTTMDNMFIRDGLTVQSPAEDGSYRYE